MSEWREVPVAEAAAWFARPDEVKFESISVYDAVHTVIVQGRRIAELEQKIAAAKALLDWGVGRSTNGVDRMIPAGDVANALGVTA